MNRFLRIAYIVGILLTSICMVIGSIIGELYPIWSFVLLWLGIFTYMLGDIIPNLKQSERIFKVIGIILMLGGAAFIALDGCHAVYYAIHAAAVILTIVLERVLNYNTTHFDFLSKFKYSLTVVVLLFCVVGLFSSGVQNQLINGGNTFAAIINSVPLFVISVVMGILLLRGLRAVTDQDNEFNRRQFRDTLLFFVGCVLITATGLIGLLKRLFIWLGGGVLEPLAAWIGKQFSLLEDALTNKNPPPIGSPAEDPIVPTRSDITPPPSMEAVTYPPETPPPEESSSDFARVLIILFAVLVIALALYIVFSKLLKQGKKTLGNSYFYEEREQVTENESDGRTEKPDRSPRSKIRQYYARFLRYLKKNRKYSVKKSDTCEEVEKLASVIGAEARDALPEFTETYRKARYDLDEEPTAEDAKRAKRLYKTIVDK